jgi:hypothetical protein
MVFRGILAASLLCAAARADFSYDQTSKMTGGAMMGMMKVAGAFSKAAREPMRSTVLVKGDRMAMVSADHINVIDLNAETFTDIDLKKNTYATITFAEMGRAMAKIAEKMGQQKEAEGVNLQFKADVKPTGQTRIIEGLNTKETILTLAMEGADAKTGNKGAMQFVMDMWLAPAMPGYEEVRVFHTKLAQKLAWNPMGGMAGAMMNQHSKGMAELVKEMSKLDGIPVLQVTRIGGTGTGMPTEADMAAAQQAGAQQQQQPAPNVSDAAGQAAAGAALGRAGRLGGLAGGLGGFGGLGRKKKNQEQAEQQAPAPQPAAQQQASTAPPSGSPGVLMELTTELTGFSSSPVDASKFGVPAGFKQVEHDMAKALK